MGEGRAALEDAHAGFEEVVVEGASGPGGVDVVGALGQDHLDAESAEGGHAEGLGEFVGGEEVGREELDAAPGAADGEEKQVGGTVGQAVGAAVDDARGHVARGNGAEMGGVEKDVGVFAGHHVPVAEEPVLEGVDGGAEDAEMVVLDGAAGTEGALRVVEVAAAGEGDAAVHHEGLAVVAEVELELFAEKVGLGPAGDGEVGDGSPAPEKAAPEEVICNI